MVHNQVQEPSDATMLQLSACVSCALVAAAAASTHHSLFCITHRSCQRDDGTEDLKKGTQQLEVYALEIQMFTEQRNNKKLKTLYQKALAVKSAIPHPRIMGIIRECGGKMHMHDQLWSDAATDFFEVGHVT